MVSRARKRGLGAQAGDKIGPIAMLEGKLDLVASHSTWDKIQNFYMTLILGLSCPSHPAYYSHPFGLSFILRWAKCTLSCVRLIT